MFRLQYFGLLALVTLVALLHVEPAVGQVTEGRISGTITDPSGAVVPGSIVTAVLQERNLTWRTTTNQLGRYVFPTLPLGTYSVRVTAPGFKTTEMRNVPLEVNASPSLDVTLEIGETTQSVTAEASAPLLVTESGSVGQVVENKFITDMPLNGRNFQQLLNLTPGSSGGTEPSINGSGKDTTEYFLDGGSIKYRNWQGGGYRGSTPLQPSIDIIQEFKVQTSAMSAEYGRSGTAINLVTKSGTNELHGSLFEFHRNNAIAARNFFQPDVSPLKQNQFGASVGGPVIRNRTFFLFGYEGSRIRAGTDFNVTVPTEAMRAGDFTGQNSIYDPATLRADPQRPAQTIADPFPANRIPAARFSRAAAFFQPFYDLPNTAPDRLIVSTSAPDDFDQVSLRLDHRFNDRINTYGRWTRTGKTAVTPSPFTRLNPDQEWSDTPQHLTLAYTHTLRPTTLLEVTYSRFRTDLRFDNPLTGTDFFGPAGVRGFEDIQTSPEYRGFPRISISGFQRLDSGLFTPVRQPQKTQQIKGSLTYIRGGHILKTGFDYRHERAQFWQTLRTHGDVSFGLQYTINPARSAGSGSGYADFLLGLPSSITRSFEIDLYGELWRSSHFFLQDDWKVTRNLTLNLGLRYEYSPPPANNQNAMASLDTEIEPMVGRIIVSTDDAGNINFNAQRVAKPTYDLFRIVFVTNRDVELPSSLAKSDKLDLAPRIGFAWQPKAGGKTVVRGGYGIFYLVENASPRTSSTTGTIPWSFTDRPTNSRPIPDRTFENFYLGQPFPSAVGVPSIHHFPQLSYYAPYEQEWNLAVQRSFAQGTVVEAGYIGKLGLHLWNTMSLNAPEPGPGNIQNRRPFPKFSSGTSRTHDGLANYHGLQIKMERRFSRGLALLGHYTFSKSIIETYNSGEGANIQDPRNRAGSRGRSDTDIRHRAVVTWTYRLPSPDLAGGFLRQVVGGWQISSLVTLQSGPPFTPGISIDNANTGTSAQRPDRIGGGEGAKTLDKWFKPEDFVMPQQYRFGNSGSNILDGDGLANVDFALMKNFTIREKYTFQFRSEFFNLMNHPDFDRPVANINDRNVARVFGATSPRIIQFGLKFLY